MSRGDLQEMEVGVKQSKTAVNANAKPADPMQTLTTGGTPPNVEDLGGPTPENYKPDDDSAKLKPAGKTLKQVRDVVNKGSVAAMPMQGNMKKEEEEVEGDVVAEAESPEAEEMKMKKDDDLAGAPNQKKKMKKEDTEVEELNIEDDVNALLGGEELTEEFKAKAKTIFEAAINAKVSEVRATLEEEFEERLAEQVTAEKEALQERVDSYLEYVSDEWVEENQLAIVHGLKSELTESFLTGMRGLFEDHYVNIPDDKYDVLETMVEKLDDMETKLNEQIEKNINLNNRLAESVADGIFESVSEGLASTQKEKLASLAESVEFESEEEYREKLETLKEGYFTSKTSTTQTETLSEGESAAPVSYTGSMEAYLKTLSKFK